MPSLTSRLMSAPSAGRPVVVVGGRRTHQLDIDRHRVHCLKPRVEICQAREDRLDRRLVDANRLRAERLRLLPPVRDGSGLAEVAHCCGHDRVRVDVYGGSGPALWRRPALVSAPIAAHDRQIIGSRSVIDEGDLERVEVGAVAVVAVLDRLAGIVVGRAVHREQRDCGS